MISVLCAMDLSVRFFLNGDTQIYLLLSLHSPQTIPLQTTSSSVFKDPVSQKFLLPHPYLP